MICLFSDVDTPEPDEKSIITYVSQLYDVFPEPPPGHPLFDAEAQKKFDQFKELASSLHVWIREHITIMQVRTHNTHNSKTKFSKRKIFQIRVIKADMRISLSRLFFLLAIHFFCCTKILRFYFYRSGCFRYFLGEIVPACNSF